MDGLCLNRPLVRLEDSVWMVYEQTIVACDFQISFENFAAEKILCEKDNAWFKECAAIHNGGCGLFFDAPRFLVKYIGGTAKRVNAKNRRDIAGAEIVFTSL